MNSPPTHTGPAAFLVDLADTHALVDAVGERLFVFNAAAAAAWCGLSSGTPAQTPFTAAFAAELAELGLLPAELAQPRGDLAPIPGEPQPRILAQTPLQVAAGTSDPNPFSSDPIW